MFAIIPKSAAGRFRDLRTICNVGGMVGRNNLVKGRMSIVGLSTTEHRSIAIYSNCVKTCIFSFDTNSTQCSDYSEYVYAKILSEEGSRVIESFIGPSMCVKSDEARVTPDSAR